MPIGEPLTVRTCLVYGGSVTIKNTFQRIYHQRQAIHSRENKINYWQTKYIKHKGDSGLRNFCACMLLTIKHELQTLLYYFQYHT